MILIFFRRSVLTPLSTLWSSSSSSFVSLSSPASWLSVSTAPAAGTESPKKIKNCVAFVAAVFHVNNHHFVGKGGTLEVNLPNVTRLCSTYTLKGLYETLQIMLYFRDAFCL